MERNVEGGGGETDFQQVFSRDHELTADGTFCFWVLHARTGRCLRWLGHPVLAHAPGLPQIPPKSMLCSVEGASQNGEDFFTSVEAGC